MTEKTSDFCFMNQTHTHILTVNLTLNRNHTEKQSVHTIRRSIRINTVRVLWRWGLAHSHDISVCIGAQTRKYDPKRTAYQTTIAHTQFFSVYLWCVPLYLCAISAKTMGQAPNMHSTMWRRSHSSLSHKRT